MRIIAFLLDPPVTDAILRLLRRAWSRRRDERRLLSLMV